MQNQKREVKVLLSCDPHGLLQSLFTKVTQLHQKNHFDFILLSGEVCHPTAAKYISELRSGEKALPIPAYFIDNSQMSPVLQRLHPNGVQLAPNLHFLGQHGVKTIKDVTIAYFSHDHWQGHPQQDQIQQFLQQTKTSKIDILLTNTWPIQAKEYSKQPSVKTEQSIAKLLSSINPHYHVAAGTTEFYRMPPYLNSQGFLTHFISIAPYNDPPTGKYLFGLTVKPQQEETPSTLVNSIQNPYAGLAAKAVRVQNLQGRVKTNFTVRNQPDNSEVVVYFEGFPQWSRNSDITEFLQRWGQLRTIQVQKELVRGSRCGTARFRSSDSTASCLASSQKVLFHTKRIKFSKRTLRQTRRVDDCWFCKTKADDSLIVFEGHHAYLSLQKGPLSRYHLQLIPFAHVETTGRLEVHQKEQLQRLAKAVSGHYSQQGFEVIVYERYLPLSQAINHAVLHIVPVKQGTNLLNKFEELNRKDHLGFKGEGEEMRKAQYFIRAEVCGKVFVKEIGRKQRVQADFMRIVLSQLLGNARLANWKQCVREETQVKEVRAQVVSMLKKIAVIVSE